MQSVKFKGCNKIFGSENVPGHLYIMSTGDNKVIAFKLSFFEKIKMFFGGRIWFWFQSQGVPDFSLTTKQPHKIIPFKKQEEK